jgi:4-oxalocrotonate tautomerase
MDSIVSSRFTGIKRLGMVQPGNSPITKESDMPGILLTVSGQADQALTDRLARHICDVTSTVLKKPRDRTWAIVHYEPRENWFIDGRSLVEHGKNAFRLLVTITDETNSKEAKADYHKAAFNLLSSIIGDVHPISNIYVVDCRATGYGYGGVTQEYFFHHQPAQ